MADPPRRSDRSDSNRYETLRDLESQKSEPTRPETIRSPGWAQSADRPAQERSAVEYNKAAQAHSEKQWQAKQQPQRPEEKQQEKTDQTREKEARIRELAEKFAPKENSPDRQREREQER